MGRSLTFLKKKHIKSASLLNSSYSFQISPKYSIKNLNFDEILKQIKQIFDQETENNIFFGNNHTFSIYEDIKLFLKIKELQKEKQGLSESEIFNITHNFFEESNIVRSNNSLKKRYKSFLIKMKCNDWHHALNHIKKFGLVGFFYFDRSEIDKFFLGIVYQDPMRLRKKTTNYVKSLCDNFIYFYLKDRNLRKEEIKQRFLKNCKLLRSKIEKREEENDNKVFSFHESLLKNIEDANKKLFINFEPMKIEDRFLNRQNEKLKHDSNNLNKNKKEFDKLYINQLDSQLLLQINEIQKKLNLSKEKICQNYMNVSGYLPDLHSYYYENKVEYLWTVLDDEVLKKSLNAEDLGFKLLLKYKGTERIERRLKFKGLHLDFEF